MPRVYTVDDVDQATKEAIKKKGPCGELREDFKLCVLNSDCIQVRRKKAQECFDTNDMPPECTQLRTMLYDCKRSLIDNRMRFRGRRDY